MKIPQIITILFGIVFTILISACLFNQQPVCPLDRPHCLDDQQFTNVPEMTKRDGGKE